MSDLYRYLLEQGLIGDTKGEVAGVSYEVQCAWCLREQGLPMGAGSHGICAQHRDQEREHYQTQRARRQGRR